MSTLACSLSSQPPRGTVYGSLLNFRSALEALGDSVHRPPATPLGSVAFRFV